jgi:SAM-dependent methyltransferase
MFKVLDVGCGGQPFRHAVESRGLKYFSLDVQNYYDAVDFIAAIDGELPALLLETGPFDFILCSEVLEHVADWDRGFHNLATLLKPGGRALLTCPFFYFLHEQPYDFWRPTSYALEHFANRQGLVCTTMRVGDAWDVLGTLLGGNLETGWPKTDRLADRFLARAVNVATRTTFFLLKRARKRVWWGNSDWPFYLSNIATKIPKSTVSLIMRIISLSCSLVVGGSEELCPGRHRLSAQGHHFMFLFRVNAKALRK